MGLFSSHDDADLARIERKLDLIIDHLGIAPPEPAWQREVRDLIARGQKIAAIKRTREGSGRGLRSAKAFVEDIEREGVPPV